MRENGVFLAETSGVLLTLTGRVGRFPAVNFVTATSLLKDRRV